VILAPTKHSQTVTNLFPAEHSTQGTSYSVICVHNPFSCTLSLAEYITPHCTVGLDLWGALHSIPFMHEITHNRSMRGNLPPPPPESNYR
jgi:hypothetical protein